MKRNDIIQNAGYWTAQIQIRLYQEARKFMKNTGKNQSQLAEYLGVSRGYVSQLLNGDYDHRLSKLVKLALAFGLVPVINFEPIEVVIAKDTMHIDGESWRPSGTTTSSHIMFNASILSDNYVETNSNDKKTAA